MCLYQHYDIFDRTNDFFGVREFLLTTDYFFLKYCTIGIIIIMLIMMYFNIILLARSKFTEKNGLPKYYSLNGL